MFKVVNVFSYNQKFVPQPLSALAPAYIHVKNNVGDLNVCYSETARLIFINYRMGFSFKWVLKIYSNSSAPLNKMAARTKLVKHFKIQNKKSFEVESLYIALGLTSIKFVQTMIIGRLLIFIR